MSHSDIAFTVSFFQSICPEPTTKNFSTQLGVHFEEISEMLDELEGVGGPATMILEMAKQANKALSMYLKQNDDVVRVKDRVEFLDALCDQLVTATGTGHMVGMDIAGGFAEVNRSNCSKLDEKGRPILDENQKFIKGPYYFKPNLKPFV